MSEDVCVMFAKVLDNAIADGLTLPVTWMSIGLDGSMLGGRFAHDGNGDVGCSVLVEHTGDPATGILGLPVHILLVDSVGRASQITVGPAVASPPS